MTTARRVARNQADRDTLESLLDRQSVRPEPIRAAETATMRALIMLTAPLWLSSIVAALLVRLIRGRLPLIVLHERVGLGRTILLVPKVATTAIDENRRRFGGLVEIARQGSPTRLNVEATPERWLRLTGIDELPQLVLVAAGKMRVVGPRPVTADELTEMGAGCAEADVGVDFLTPGIVGLWQVLNRHAYELPERRALDLLMIDNWSPRLRRRILGLSLRQAMARITPRGQTLRRD